MKRLALLAMLLTSALTLRGELSPRVLLTWETRDSGTGTLTQLRQDVEVFLDRAVAEGVTYRLGMGANRLESETSFLETRRDTSTFEMRPTGRVEVRVGRIAWDADYALRRSSAEISDRRSIYTNEQILTKFAWSALPWLPNGEVRAMRYRLGDDRFSEDLVNELAEVTLSHSWCGLNVSGGQNVRRQIDDRNGYTRTTGEQLGSISYAQALFDQRLTFSASANGSLTMIDDSAGERSTRIPNPVAIVRALSGVDDTPLDSTDRPLSSNPALTDGRLDISAGINLGPDGESFQTIMLDFGRIAEVDRIDVVVRDERGDRVLQSAGIRWDVYTSVDGERWTAHLEGNDQQFDSIRSQFEISFSSIDVRWIKVVSFGVAAQPVFVTEVRALFHTTLTSGSRESEYRNVMGSTSLTWTPLRPLSFNYTGSTYISDYEIGGIGTSTIEDMLHSISARYDGPWNLSYDTRYEVREASTDRNDESSTSLLGGLRWMPRPQLMVSTFCDLRDEVRTFGDVESRTCNANVTARLYPTLDVSFGGSDRSEERLTEGGEIHTTSLHATATARVRPTLRFVVSGTSSRSTATGDVEAALPPTRDDRINLSSDWNPGRALGLGATFGWVAGDAISGIVQRYRVRWSPFGDGSVSLHTSYQTDIDPYSNSRSERILISPRWQVNRRTALSLGYSTVKTTGLYVFESESILASLSIGR
ncbi:MAG TPA: hypothetical protein VF701_08435 [Thermoanaerobaculia bacterium]